MRVLGIDPSSQATGYGVLELKEGRYAVLGYGVHLYEDLIAFCELTGIKAIAL